MKSRAVEDYLKTIYELQAEQGVAATTALAERLDVAPASVTGMVKKLAGQGLVVHTLYRGVELTPAGQEAALHLVRRHRLVECFLSDLIGMPWEQVHDEADQLEHAISPVFEARVDALLGYPTTDPHGAPIPTPNGTMPETHHRLLADVQPGEVVVVAEVSDHDPALLRYVGALHLYPGTPIQVLAAATVGETLTIAANGAEHILGRSVTRHIFVTDTRPCCAEVSTLPQKEPLHV